MKIAFDAKRAYQNNTGLGHYSRTLISSLASNFQQNQYYLCAPKLTDQYQFSTNNNLYNITPQSFLAKQFSSLWRSKWVLKDLKKLEVDIYHGLSNEIPVGINDTSIKSVVTIHDLIFERYPEQYNRVDVQIYKKKFRYACETANAIIAISEQTRQDIIELYNISPEKIYVCYQSCNLAFTKTVAPAEKALITERYNLPDQYFLYVGSIIERKNLLNICKALRKIDCNIPLVVIGEGGTYKQQVLQYIKENDLQERVIFLAEHPAAQHPDYKSSKDFPAIYQQALCLVYPSFFEGFGIPVLEALWSSLPVITSNTSCMPETSGDAAYYVDPASVEQIADALLQIKSNPTLVAEMKAKGLQHAQKFTPEKCAADVMQVYLRLL